MDKHDLIKILNEITKAAPEFLTRKKVEEITGGIFMARTLANHDSLRCGIVPRLLMAGKVVYPRHAVIAFLIKQSKVLEE